MFFKMRHILSERLFLSSLNLSYASGTNLNHYDNSFQFVARFFLTSPNELGNGSGFLRHVFIHGFGLR